MKLIYKNNKNKILILGMAIMCVVSLGIFMQGCSQEDDALSTKDELSFLDINHNLNNFSDENIKILKEVQRRMDNYVKIKDNQYYLIISSGKTVEISDYLFDIFKNSIEITNERIEKGELYINANGICYSIDNVKGFPRLKDDGENYNYTESLTFYYWGSVETTTYDQQGAYDYYHTTNQQNTFSSAIAGIITSFASWPMGVGMSVLGGAISYETAQDIYTAAKGGGITVTTTTYNGISSSSDPYVGKNVVITDKNGNQIVLPTNF